MENIPLAVKEYGNRRMATAFLISLYIGIFLFGIMSQQSWGRSSILLRNGRTVQCDGSTVTTNASVACYSGKKVGLIGAQRVSFAALKSDVAAIDINN